MADTENSVLDGIPEIEQEVEVWGIAERPTDKTLSIEDMAADAKATGDAITAVSEDLADLAADVSDIDGKTGENINVNSDPESKTIAETIQEIQEAILGEIFPVGCVITTNSATAPGFSGTWEEIVSPMTWNDLKNGNRSYTAGTGTGTLHYWLRTA